MTVAGNLDISPGAASIVPGRAKLVLQYRDPSVQQQELFQRTARRLIEECAANARIRSVPKADGVADDEQRRRIQWG